MFFPIVSISLLNLFRYKVHIRVIDDTGSASFVMWNRDIVHLINKSASEILNKKIEVSFNLKQYNNLNSLNKKI